LSYEIVSVLLSSVLAFDLIRKKIKQKNSQPKNYKEKIEPAMPTTTYKIRFIVYKHMLNDFLPGYSVCVNQTLKKLLRYPNLISNRNNFSVLWKEVLDCEQNIVEKGVNIRPVSLSEIVQSSAIIGTDSEKLERFSSLVATFSSTCSIFITRITPLDVYWLFKALRKREDEIITS
jgi:hypothetical protein